MKFWKYGLIGLLALLLVGCGQQLSTTKATYGRNGLVATIKGSASGVDRVHYTSQAGNGSVPVKSGTFVVNVPVTDTTQQIKLTAGSLKREVNVKAGTSLGQYTAIASLATSHRFRWSAQALLPSLFGHPKPFWPWPMKTADSGRV